MKNSPKLKSFMVDVVFWTIMVALALTAYGILADISDFIEYGRWQ